MPKVYHDPLIPPTKICNSCHVEKPLDDFYKSNVGKYGHLAQCKDCIQTKSTEYHTAHYQHKRPSKPAPVNGGKVCTRCLVEKPLEEFVPRKDSKTKHGSHCKECRNFLAREASYRRGVRHKPTPLPPALNGGKVCKTCLQEKPLEAFPKETRRQSGYSPRCKECTNTYNRNYYAENNKESILLKNQRWYEANRKRHRAMVIAWTQENRAKANQYGAQRRARKKAVTIEEVDYNAILERDGMFCYICEQEITSGQKAEFEHVIPLARGGIHSMDNIKIAHMVCNRRKGDKLLSEMKPHQRRGIV